MSKIKAKIRDYLLSIPNLLHDSVPDGVDEKANVTIKTFGKKPKFTFKPKGHAHLVEHWANLEDAARIAGARWYFLKGDLALLEMALTRYAVDFMMKKGYTLCVPPHMINRKAYEGVTTLDTFEEMLYKIEGEDLYMIATSEHPLTAQFMGQVLDEKALPLKLVGYSTNFRKEAGSHGKDTKGIFRVHQFNKVEQVIICKPEDSWSYHEEMVKNANEFFDSLGLHFKQVVLSSGDTGNVAAKTYDLEVWYPEQGKYREIASESNCLTYQSRRLGIRYQQAAGRDYVHTLNGTCVPTSRALCAILENFQRKDGSIAIPKVLLPYMNGKKVLKR